MNIPSNLFPIAYRIEGEEDIKIEARKQRGGEIKWVVSNGRGVLNRELEWEWEPMPSNREGDFLARTRFDSVNEAYECFLQTSKTNKTDS
jgi:hypothetical protein